jgi:hypothetical protein
LVERRPYKANVSGSTPLAPTRQFKNQECEVCALNFFGLAILNKLH